MKRGAQYLIGAGGFAALVLVALTAQRTATAPVSLMAAFTADHAHEAIGVDGIHCWRVALPENEFIEAVNALGLSTMDTYPAFETSKGNCGVAWWDIDFPKEAQRYWRSEDGNVRKLAAYRDGRLYFSHEHR